MNNKDKARKILQLGEDDWSDMEDEYLKIVKEILSE